MTERIKPPEHLTAESKRWFQRVITDYQLEAHHVLLLQSAAECWDRAAQARGLLAAEGVCFKDRHGHIRPHPATQIERDSKTLFARLLRELALDIESPEDSRPPTIRGSAILRGGE